jgi:hypothetical protein
MSEEVHVLIAPIVQIPVETIVPPVEHLQLPDAVQEMPRPEQAKAAEAYFTHQQDENRQVAGLLGMWAGTLLLHDLAVEHFEERDELDEERERKEGKDE